MSYYIPDLTTHRSLCDQHTEPSDVDVTYRVLKQAGEISNKLDKKTVSKSAVVGGSNGHHQLSSSDHSSHQPVDKYSGKKLMMQETPSVVVRVPMDEPMPMQSGPSTASQSVRNATISAGDYGNDYPADYPERMERMERIAAGKRRVARQSSSLAVAHVAADSSCSGSHVRGVRHCSAVTAYRIYSCISGIDIKFIIQIFSQYKIFTIKSS